ncbi:MAG TPA: response regulator [Thermoanaerobaculia bacterium]|nr:response regulator [Thermoanaerobaculia bacterium]
MTDRRRRYRALVVEDDRAIRELVKVVLEREGFMVEAVREATSAIELLRTVQYDLLILDLILPVVGGEKVLTFLSDARPATLRRVILTTASPRQLSCEFLERICTLLEKPFDIEALVLIARECASGEAA